MSSTCLAIDIGATKIVVGRVAQDGSVLDRRQVPTTDVATGDELFARIADAIDATGVADSDVACGVGTAGPLLEGGRVSPLNISVWREFPLRARLEAHVDLPVEIEMDGLAIARAEGWIGGAAGASNYASFIVSTGIGGGVVIDGRLLSGRTGNAGHIGHIPVVDGGRLCACGGCGCLEAEASGTAIAAMTGRPAPDASLEVRERAGYLVGRAAGALANLLDLDVVTLSGGVALGFGAPFIAAAQTGAAETATLAFSRGLRVELSVLGADGPLIGAAATAFARLSEGVSA